MEMVVQYLGFVGSALVIWAYVPQIRHLVKEHCAAGISRQAYILWLVAGMLLLLHALMIKDSVFILLQSVGIVASGLVLFFAEKYKYGFCPGHTGL